MNWVHPQSSIDMWLSKRSDSCKCELWVAKWNLHAGGRMKVLRVILLLSEFLLWVDVFGYSFVVAHSDLHSIESKSMSAGKDVLVVTPNFCYDEANYKWISFILIHFVVPSRHLHSYIIGYAAFLYGLTTIQPAN